MIQKWSGTTTTHYYKPFRERADRLGLNQKDFKRIPKQKNTKDISVFLENKKAIAGCDLKEKLLSLGLLENRCIACGITPDFNRSLFANPLSLQMDHIDGNSSNNSFNNLRILCPNCHTRTDTYGGRNGRRTLFNNCPTCNKKINIDSKTCVKHRPHREPVIFPIVDSKECSNCKVTKSSEMFSKNKTQADGLGRYCKECFSLKNKQARTRNPEIYRERTRKWRENSKSTQDRINELI